MDDSAILIRTEEMARELFGAGTDLYYACEATIQRGGCCFYHKPKEWNMLHKHPLGDSVEMWSLEASVFVELDFYYQMWGEVIGLFPELLDVGEMFL